MAEPITSAIMSAGLSLADVVSAPLSISGKEQLVQDIKSKNTERQRRLEKIKDQSLMQQATFRQGGKVNQESPPPKIIESKPIDPESEYLGRLAAAKASRTGELMKSTNKKGGAAVKQKTLPKDIVKQAYYRGMEKVAEEMGFEKDAFIWAGLKGAGRMVGRASQAVGLTGAKTRNVAMRGNRAVDPAALSRLNRMKQGKGVSYAANPAGGMTRTRKGWWGRQSTGNKAQLLGGVAAVGGGYGASKALDAHSKSMNSPNAFKPGKPNNTAARLAAKTYGY